jgi:hypothetical protein
MPGTQRSRCGGGGRDFGRLQESQRNFIRLMFLEPKFRRRLFYNTFDLERFRLERLRIVTYPGSEMMLSRILGIPDASNPE